MDKNNLSNYDFVVLIDKSGSMETGDGPGGKTRWEQAREYAESIAAKAGQFDTDGIDVITFGATHKVFNGVTADKVAQIFQEVSPGGSTNTAGALAAALDAYKAKKAAGSTKNLLVVVVTDGIPDDKAALAKVITDHANSMSDDSETGITFVQIGKDAAARTFLKSLDDDLKGAKFDIVDTKDVEEMENISITDLLEAAIAD
jgi:Mg-chelatase subunit ChlD